MISLKLPVSSADELAARIDHTVLRPEEKWAGIMRAIEEAESYKFRALVIPPWAVKEVSSLTKVMIATVISFPLGHDTIEAKKRDIELALSEGAKEVDVVINIMAALSGRMDIIEREISELTQLTHSLGGGIKFILETGMLDPQLISKISKVVEKNQGDYIKTSTGFGPRGATIDDILTIRSAVSRAQKVKASGGIRTAVQALLMLAAGADIIGASSSVKIVKEFQEAYTLITQKL